MNLSIKTVVNPMPSDRRDSENKNKSYYTYIMASKRNGVLYVGVTPDLIKRVYEHKNNQVEGYTCRHSVQQLVYFEQHLDVNTAIRRGKRLQEWRRKWKLALIEIDNPAWRDLYPEIVGAHQSCASNQAINDRGFFSSVT